MKTQSDTKLRFYFYNVITAFLITTILSITANPDTVLYDTQTNKLSGSPFVSFFNQLGVTWLFVFAFLFIFFKYIQKTAIHFSKSILIASLMFSFFMILGISFQKTSGLTFITANGVMLFYNIVAFIGFTILFYALIWVFYEKILLKDTKIFHTSSKFWNKCKEIYTKHPNITTIVLLTLGWLPYFIAYWPGSLPADGVMQLNIFFGPEKLTNHHPIFSTVMMGYIMKLGQAISGSRLGVFLYVMLQTVLFEIAIVYMLRVFRKLSFGATPQLLSILYFALVPVWGAYMESQIKDSLFAVMTLYWSIQLMFFIIDSTVFCKWKNLIFFILTSIILCWLRNNSIYIVLGTLVFMLIVKQTKKSRGTVLVLLVSVVALYGIHTKVVIPALDAEDNRSTQEMLSIPFQQTARYVKENGKEVTAKEKKAIDSVLTYSALQNYNPNISDPVKNSYRGAENISDAQMKEYFNVWFKMLLKHPQTYIESFIAGTYGYYYPGQQHYVLATYQCYIKNEYNNYCYYDYIPQLEGMRNVVLNASHAFIQIPVIGYLMNPGMYTWLMIALGFFCFYKRKLQYLALLVPSYLTIAVCIASPVNGLVRYMLPVMVVTPLLLAVMTYLARKKEQ